MMWLAWRQFRAQAWVAAAALAAVAIIMVSTGIHLAHLYDTSGIVGCHPQACQTLANNFLSGLRHSSVYVILYDASIVVLYAVPAIVGVFWGAPLITGEIEAGTLRLAWSQSVTRTRWLAAKLAFAGLASMALAGLFSLLTTWWYGPVERAVPLAGARQSLTILNRFDPPVFSTHGIVPIGYAAFAFALGVTAGVLIRRMAIAMASTLAVFVGVQFAWPLWIRPHLVAPLRRAVPLDPAAIDTLSVAGPGHMTIIAGVNMPRSWVLSNQTVNAAGHPFTGPGPRPCVSPSAGFQACQAAIGGLHLRQLVTYQPASRYWAFQWGETAIFLALALALAWFCFWWIRSRRVS
jgi:hypothetical protein